MTDFALTSLRSGNARRFLRAFATRVSDGAARWASQSALAAFGRVLRDAAAKRALELELTRADDPSRLSQVGELLPRRIGAAQISLVALDYNDAADLRDFIDVTSDVARAAIARAETVEELVDAVGDALDSLHSFLVAHDFVARDYLEAVSYHYHADPHTHASEDEDWERVAADHRHDEQALTQPATENNLALAA